MIQTAEDKVKEYRQCIHREREPDEFILESDNKTKQSSYHLPQ